MKIPVVKSVIYQKKMRYKIKEIKLNKNIEKFQLQISKKNLINKKLYN